ncbi:MAG: hypothetical protein ACFE94_04035 [Candidatus Hodarchaeota archaeon]
MRISIHPELERVWKLYSEGNLEEGLQLLIDFEKLGDQTLEDKHYYRYLKAWILFNMTKIQESLRIAEQDYQESKSQNKPLFFIDSIFLKFFILQLTGSFSPYNKKGKIWDDIFSSEKLLKSITQEPLDEVKLRESFLFTMNGYYFYWGGSFDKGIELFKKSLAISEKYGVFGSGLTRVNLWLLGTCYTFKGELDFALDFHKKTLDHIKATHVIIPPLVALVKGAIYNNIGSIYFQKGALDQAIQYFEKSLKILEPLSDTTSIAWSGGGYKEMIKLFLYKDSREEAQQCLDHFYQYLGKKDLSIIGKLIGWKDPEDMVRYRLSKAYILASSSRVKDRAEAENIAKEICEEIQAIDALFDNYYESLLLLCELYFQEFIASNDLAILEDIQPLVDKLIKASEQRNSFLLQTQAFLLNGKISLLQLNMGDARRYLTEAQQIADSHSLHLLARAISYEHDKLLEQLERLESYKKKKLPIPERLDLASLDDTLDLMHGRRAVNAPELIDEEPVLLLIIAEGGVPAFSNPFTEDWSYEDGFISNFLTAFNTFSKEVFSKGLDRAKFGEYTIIMKPVGFFSICYLFKGQTYLATQKLTQFAEKMESDSSIWQPFKDFHRTHQAITLKDNPSLEHVISNIFLT